MCRKLKLKKTKNDTKIFTVDKQKHYATNGSEYFAPSEIEIAAALDFGECYGDLVYTIDSIEDDIIALENAYNCKVQYEEKKEKNK